MAKGIRPQQKVSHARLNHKRNLADETEFRHGKIMKNMPNPRFRDHEEQILHGLVVPCSFAAREAGCPRLDSRSSVLIQDYKMRDLHSERFLDRGRSSQTSSLGREDVCRSCLTVRSFRDAPLVPSRCGPAVPDSRDSDLPSKQSRIRLTAYRI